MSRVPQITELALTKQAQRSCDVQEGRSLDQCSIHEVYGQKPILDCKVHLAALAELHDLTGVADDLEFIFSDPYFGSKIPHLFLISEGGGEAQAAVLLYEYSLRGIPTGVFIPADLSGELTVIASEGERAMTVRRVAHHLMRKGAKLALFSVKNADLASEAALMKGSAARATQTRVLRQTLLLRDSFDDTLAQFGARSRRNFRAARRRVDAELNVTFHPSLEMSIEEYVAMNRDSAYKVPDRIAVWRYRMANSERGLFSGLRAKDGRWLSLVGGRHRHHTTMIDWQVNRQDMPAYSLATAMRSYLMEFEIGRGTEALRFEGGTPHSMQNGFETETVGDLLVATNALSPNFLKHAVSRLLPKGNLLATLLNWEELRWHT